VYRFLATPRWLGYAALTVAAATVMVFLGLWQLDRFHQRDSINNRIDAGATGTPTPLGQLLNGPGPGSKSVGPAPAKAVTFTRTAVSGRYDREHEVLLRGRTVNDTVGYEVVTPLVLADGSGVLVDRGWVAPPPGGAMAVPSVPAAPSGPVTVVGSLRPPESRGAKPQLVDGHLDTRRITPSAIVQALPYPLYDAYIGIDQTAPGLTPVPPEKENALQNGGYVIQWWLFAAGTVFGYFYIARKEARERAGLTRKFEGFDEFDDAHSESPL
jgi:cytochrome oxidase assembly protein ShyY1